MKRWERPVAVTCRLPRFIHAYPSIAPPGSPNTRPWTRYRATTRQGQPGDHLQSFHAPLCLPFIRKIMGIFSDVVYTLSSSLRTNDQKWLSDILDANGAARGSLEDVTHIISNTLEFEGWRSAPENAEVVTVSGHGSHPNYFI